jgi:hypothetical protein
LVHTSVSYLAGVGGVQRTRDNPAGRQLFFDAPQSVVTSSQLVIRDPDDAPVRPVIFETPLGDRRVICERPRTVGFYRLMKDTTLAAEAVVNLDTRESNIAVRSLPREGSEVENVVHAGSGFARELQEKRRGREVFAFFLLLAAAALAAESILGRNA